VGTALLAWRSMLVFVVFCAELLVVFVVLVVLVVLVSCRGFEGVGAGEVVARCLAPRNMFWVFGLVSGCGGRFPEEVGCLCWHEHQFGIGWLLRREGPRPRRGVVSSRCRRATPKPDQCFCRRRPLVVGLRGGRVMATTFATRQQYGPSFVEAATQVLLLDPSGLDIGGLKTSIGLCGTLRGIVSAVEAGFVAELERRAGRHEANEALRKKQKVSPAKAKRRSKTSKTTSEQRELAAALADGQISEEHADAIADADQAHPGAGATAALLDEAKTQSVEQFRHTAKGWERGQQHDQGEAEAERQYKARKVRSRIRPEDGMGVTIAELDPENHATFITALAWWVRKLRNNNKNGSKGSDNRSKKASDNDPNNNGSGGAGSKADIAADRGLIASTPEQLLADALVAMASASTSPAGAGSAVATARMLVIANYDVVTKTLTGRLGDGTVLSPETVRRLACDAEILPAVFGSDSQLLNLGMSARTASVGQRVSLAERDGGCRGCGASAEFCVAHHIIHWAALGPTDLDNLMLLCSRCHHLVHEGGYTVHKGPDARYVIIAPKQHPQPDAGHPNRNSSNGGTNRPNSTNNHANSANRTPSPNGSRSGHPNRNPHTGTTPDANRKPGTDGTRGPGTDGTADTARTSANIAGTLDGRATAGTDGSTFTDRSPHANGVPRTNGTSDANGILQANGKPYSGTPRKRGSHGRSESNGDLGPERHGPIGAPQRYANTAPANTAPASVRSGSNDSGGQPPGQTERGRNPIIDRCLAEARQTITNTDPQLDLFSYAR